MSLRRTFGSSKAMFESPSSGPEWRKSDLRPLVHFINCHGADVDPTFYGEDGDCTSDPVTAACFPESMTSPSLVGHIRRGTIAAAECCYGAQLYDPASVGITDRGIASRYLSEGAFAFWGSTTVSYGPSDGNDQADLICQYFLQEILNGASTGRAGLMARQSYVQQAVERRG